MLIVKVPKNEDTRTPEERARDDAAFWDRTRNAPRAHPVNEAHRLAERAKEKAEELKRA